jgi:hypothetical protein
MGSMNPGQFTIKRALASTALIAVGCLGLSMWVPGRFDAIDYGPMKTAIFICESSCCIWISAGVGLLFNRMSGGALAGLVMQAFL